MKLKNTRKGFGFACDLVITSVAILVIFPLDLVFEIRASTKFLNTVLAIFKGIFLAGKLGEFILVSGSF